MTAEPCVRRGRRMLSAMALVTLMAAALWTRPMHADVRFTDDLGNNVTLAAPARRIVSLAPHITELLFAAGAGDRVIAAVAYSDYPPAARSLPRVGDAARIDHERLLQLHPDLIIAWASGTPAHELATLRRLELPLYLSAPHRLQAIGDQLRQFGRLAGTAAAAELAAVDYEHRLQALRARYAGAARRPVFYQLALRPLLTVNAAHLIHDALALCGADNPFAGQPMLTPQVSVEAVLAARPAAVVLALYPGEAVTDSERFWRRRGMANTVRFIGVPGDYIHRATPRILEGVERICAGLADG